MSYDPSDPDFQFLAIDKKALLAKQAEMGTDSKKGCFVPDEKESWIKAEIISTKGDDVVVLSEKGAVSLLPAIKSQISN